MLDILCIRESSRTCKKFRQPYIWKLVYRKNCGYGYCRWKNNKPPFIKGFNAEAHTFSDFVILGAIVSNYCVRYQGFMERVTTGCTYINSSLLQLNNDGVEHLLYKNAIDLVLKYPVLPKRGRFMNEKDLEEVGKLAYEVLENDLENLKKGISYIKDSYEY